MKILIIEDCPNQYIDYKNQLIELGHEVVECPVTDLTPLHTATYNQAESKIQGLNDRCDLILLDLELEIGKNTGLSIINWMKKSNINIPFIIMSSHQNYLFNSMNHGLSLSKPFDKAILEEKLNIEELKKNCVELFKDLDYGIDVKEKSSLLERKIKLSDVYFITSQNGEYLMIWQKVDSSYKISKLYLKEYSSFNDLQDNNPEWLKYFGRIHDSSQYVHKTYYFNKLAFLNKDEAEIKEIFRVRCINESPIYSITKKILSILRN